MSWSWPGTSGFGAHTPGLAGCAGSRGEDGGGSRQSAMSTQTSSSGSAGGGGKAYAQRCSIASMSQSATVRVYRRHCRELRIQPYCHKTLHRSETPKHTTRQISANLVIGPPESSGTVSKEVLLYFLSAHTPCWKAEDCPRAISSRNLRRMAASCRATTRISAAWRGQLAAMGQHTCELAVRECVYETYLLLVPGLAAICRPVKKWQRHGQSSPAAIRVLERARGRDREEAKRPRRRNIRHACKHV